MKPGLCDHGAGERTRRGTGRAASGTALSLALYYAAVFAGPGVTLPFLPAFLDGRGLGAAEIAWVLAAQQLARLLSGPLAGRLADASGRRRRAAALAALGGVATSLIVLAAPAPLLLPACAIAAAVTAPLVPLGDAVALRAAALGLADFGRVRSVGSASFILGTLAGGLAVRRLGAEAVPWAMAAGCAASAAAAAALPSLEAKPARGRRLGLALLGNRRFLLLLLASGLVQGSHAAHYAFSVLWWERAGIGADLAGLLWTIGVVAEIALLASARDLAGRVGPAALLALGASAGVLRWSATATTVDPWLLAPVQALHALSFGASMLGAAALIARLVPHELGATAQTLHAALGPGLFTLALTAASGPLYARSGGLVFLAMAGVCLVAFAPIRCLARGEGRA